MEMQRAKNSQDNLEEQRRKIYTASYQNLL